MKRFCAIFFMFALAVPAFSDIFPPTGSQYVDLYGSPLLLGSYHSAVSYRGPLSISANPSFLAGIVQPQIEANYIGLIGGGSTAGSTGYKGHILNIGALLPNRIGLLGFRARGFYSYLDTASLGAGLSLGASLAKQVLPDLSVGGLLQFAFAGQPAGSDYVTTSGIDWALLGTVGFLHYLSDSPIRDLRWGVTLSNIGKGLGTGAAFDYQSGTETVNVTAYPAIFTLAAGVGLTIIDSGAFFWDVSADLSFPSFQNVELGISTGMKIADIVTVDLGTSYNLRELLPSVSPNPRSFIPGISIGITLPVDYTADNDPLGLADSDYASNDITPTVAFAPMADDVFVFGIGAVVESGATDSTPPNIEVGYSGYRYISPTGTFREISLPVSIGDDRYVISYRFSIENASGVEVWSAGESLSRFAEDETPFMDSVLYGISHRYQSIPVPARLTWKGRGADGKMLPDGEYSAFVESTDDTGNRAIAGPFRFAVDATPPSGTITLPELPLRILSPNNDGNKDTITIRQTGTVEREWRGEIRRGDFAVRTFRWTDAAPEDIVWDGHGEAGNVLSDGTYTYILSSADLAGNAVRIVSEPFVLNNQSTPISFGIDRAHFSPNGDGRQDSIAFSLGIPIQEGIVEWTAEIVDESGVTRRTIRGLRTVPASLVVDGRDNVGNYLPEGLYYGRFSILYENGNNPAEVSPQFEIDVSRPEAVVTADLTLFSPNGDGSKDEIAFFQDTTPEDLWVGKITTRSGTEIFTRSWRGFADRKFVWDGYAQNGLLAGNGMYQYQLSATDKAGNVGRSRALQFEINYGETDVVLTRSYDAFSPNSDGNLDVQTFSVSLDVEDGIESYELVIRSEDGVAVRRLGDRTKPPTSIAWQGVTDTGGRVSDGSYYAEISIRYANGNQPSARSRSFIVDTGYPEIQVATDRRLFSPNGDGNRDTVTFSSRSSREALWIGSIRSVDGKEVRQIYWPGQTSSFVWNGTDEAGNPVADGVYVFEVRTVDAAGNSAVARTEQITLDTRLTSIFISVDRARFSPNGDGVDDTVTFNMSTSVRDGVTGWQVVVRSIDGTPVRTYSGTRIPERIIWDGKDQTGKLVEGEFTVGYSVQYEKGDTPSVNSSTFSVDVSAPELTILASPSPFSPDGDGADDNLIFSMSISDASAISGWNLTIRDGQDNNVRVFTGTGRPPRTILWNGHSESGDLVESGEVFTYSMSVSDVLGNRSRASGTILVDILVFEEDGSLRIRISNLVFQSDTATYEATATDIVQRNNWILARLSDILKRLSAYHIRIEGHAMSVYWDDPAQAKVEQEEELIPITRARAETVKASLIRRGIASERIDAVGIGGAQPLVPHGDEEQNWKNQRIEIILEKQ